MLAISLLIIIIALVYIYLIRPLSYWKNLGVPYIRGYPVVGSYLQMALKKQSFSDTLITIYNTLPDETCGGMFSFGSPALLIRDPDLLKQLFIKDFNSFTDHSTSFFKDGFDNIIDKNLMVLTGNDWRDMRATLSPAFTGSKMRGMFNMMNECGQQFVDYYLKVITNLKNSKHLEVELKSIFTRFSNDIIASAVFGVKCDSLKDQNNEFYLMGCKTTYFATWRIMLSNFCPWILKFLNLGGVIPSECCNYFRNLVKETTTIRERENIIRPDILHLLMQAKKGTLKDDSAEESIGFVGTELKTTGNIKKLDDEDIAAQALLFFLGGFETTSLLICFTIYELALNPDIQERLYLEIKNALTETNNMLSYDVLHKMKYLDMIITESLRKWPPAPIADRICTKNYKIKVGKKWITLDNGFPIVVSIIGLHRDPKYYPNPEKFIPERFSDENKKNIKPLTFLPFGVGPRLCIGARFAVMEAKIMIFHLIRNFEIILVKNSTVPPRFSTKSSNTTLENGFNVGLKLRTF